MKDRQAKSGSEDDQEVKIMKESEVDVTDKDQRKYLKRVKKALKEHEEADASLARQKLTEMRLKKKRKMKDRRGGGQDDDAEDGGYEVTIGNPDEDSQAEDHEDEGDPEPVVKAKKSKKRVRIAEEEPAGETEEQRALRLIGQIDDF
jgi:hypothetical protein